MLAGHCRLRDAGRGVADHPYLRSRRVAMNGPVTAVRRVLATDRLPSPRPCVCGLAVRTPEPDHEPVGHVMRPTSGRDPTRQTTRFSSRMQMMPTTEMAVS